MEFVIIVSLAIVVALLPHRNSNRAAAPEMVRVARRGIPEEGV